MYKQYRDRTNTVYTLSTKFKKKISLIILMTRIAFYTEDMTGLL